MKTWTRSPRRLFCGKCRADIQVGDPVLIYQSAANTWRKFRCAQCAGEAVPADLPELEPQPVASPWQHVGSTTAFDWKRDPQDVSRARMGRHDY